MAKINKVSRENAWRVRIDVDDPDCIWNINPTSTYFRIFKANNPNAAIRSAANYCNKQMKSFPGVEFKYSTKEVEPYYCMAFENNILGEDNTGVKKIKI